MKVLVLTENYPNNEGGISLMYVHTRNVYYHEHGWDVDNLNFSAKTSYKIDGIQVLTFNDYKHSNRKYDVLILHAPNIRHHYIFLKKYGNRFKRFVFFFHGHEVLKTRQVYSKPYPYIHNNKIWEFLKDRYDDFKLYVWRNYLPKIIYKSKFIFVSSWMLAEFEKWTKINRSLLEGQYSITYNCVSREFEAQDYNSSQIKEYDFVTIRANIDGSKYSIDIVNQLAKNTPKGRFLIVGKGEFFKFNSKADNIEWRNNTLSHSEIIALLNKSKYALMPTRTDAQGLMMCEMAAFGIPVITSDISVCHEVFDGFNNVFFIDNNDMGVSLDSFLDLSTKCIKQTCFYKENTIKRELGFIQNGMEK